MIGINVNDKLYPFTEWILDQQKIYETRNSPSLRPYVGKTVGLVRTGKGKAILVGYIHIVEEIMIDNEDQFYSMSDLHKITKEMAKFSFHNRKFLYHIDSVQRINPVPVYSKGIVARKIDYEF